MIIKNRYEILRIAKENWSILKGCKVEDFDLGVKFIVDFENKKEIQVLSMKNSGTILNIPEECFEELLQLIKKYGLNKTKISEFLKNKYSGDLEIYEKKQFYLFTDKKLLEVNKNVRKLKKSEKFLFDDFRKKCSYEDNYEVYMDFNESFHNFYAYFAGNEIVSLGDFCKIGDKDKVVLPSIITRENFRGKGYGKALLNMITHEIIKLGFVARYPVSPNNKASINLAKSLGYEEIFENYSLSIKE